ncbi:hypothetical protein CC86DRAFT_365284, partial [Ophiobolus disseminans]
MPYDRDIVINCIERHYDLLVRMAYLDPGVILRPPPEGWSDEQLAVDTLQKWKRSDKVIDLLRHMPYLSKNMFTDKYDVYIETEASIYLRNFGWLQDEYVTKSPSHRYGNTYSLMMPFEEDSPAGLIPLTQGNKGTVWMIDTDEGVIWPMGSFIVDRDAPEDQPWRQCAKPRDIQEYFDELYNEISTLITVPVPKTQSGYSWYHELLPYQEEQGELAQRLLKQHGWPGAFRKAEYIDALEKARRDARDEELERREEKVRRRAKRREVAGAVGKTYNLRSKSGRGDSTV